MSRRRIYFANISNVFPILPYQWGILRAAAETDPEVAAGYRFMEPFFLPRRAEAMACQVRSPAVLALSCFVWNTPLQLKLARLVKARHPRCLVVAGGGQIPRRPGDFFHRHPEVDVIIPGEGESTFRRLLRGLLGPNPALEAVAGLAFNRGGEAVHTDPCTDLLPARISDELLPSPYLAGHFDGLIRRLRKDVPRIWALWETTRGCPQGCDFCDYGGPEHNRIKRFGLQRTRDELDYLARARVDLLFVADANFGLLPRDLELARHLGRSHRETGYPGQIKANFSHQSGERTVAMARELHREGLLTAGLTLSAQSGTPEVVAGAGRREASPLTRAEVKRACDAQGIPSYVDTLLGLPGESRASWIKGLCSLLEEGHHEDIRLFELYLLPNARLGSPQARRDSGLVTRFKRLNPRLPADEVGMVEAVCQTNTLGVEEWVQCVVFSDLYISALHCGGYTRLLARYLAREELMTYEAFYGGLFELGRRAPHTPLGRVHGRLARLQRDYLDNPAIPVQGRVGTQADMFRFLLPYSHPHKFVWWPHDWAWLVLNERLDELDGQVAGFLADAGIGPGAAATRDLLHFQRDLVLTPEYDPARGKIGRYAMDWPAYFFDHAPLARGPVEVRFRDRAMGSRQQHPLRRKDRSAFALAACGNYYPDGKHRRFTHQPDAMEIIRSS